MDFGLRYRNYLREVEALIRKLSNPRIDPKKKDRCTQRLADLTNRLLPTLQHHLSRSRNSVLTTA